MKKFLILGLATMVTMVTRAAERPPNIVINPGGDEALLLTFADRNPGITRILTGDALAGETERLHLRVAQLFDRFVTQLKQVIREAEMREGLRPVIPLPAAANLLMAAAEGRISQYVRSGFQRSPTTDWSQQWALMMQGFFREAISQPVPGQASSLAG